MTRLLTQHIATMTELREPHKVLERAGGKPVAILKNSQVVGYLVPQEAVEAVDARVATMDEVLEKSTVIRSKISSAFSLFFASTMMVTSIFTWFSDQVSTSTLP